MSQIHSPKIISVATIVPENKFTQEAMIALIGIEDKKTRRFFEHPHIKTRHLLFPRDSKTLQEEGPTELRKKFLDNSIELISRSVKEALIKAGISASDVGHVTCVTSTGFVVPGLTALVMEKIELKPNCQRLDVVGMGCNAGLNGMNAAVNWAKVHPDQYSLLICCELCSCIYSHDETENSALVNSLFGDGVAVAVITTKERKGPLAPAIIDSETYLIPDSLGCLRFDWNIEKNRNTFFVDKTTPEKLAHSIEKPLSSLLKRAGLKQSDIEHWIVHTGGEAILSGIENQLKLDPAKLKHTRSVLNDYGNISSGSFLFSYQRLMDEKSIRPDDFGIMITMGPGLTIEMALLQWKV